MDLLDQTTLEHVRLRGSRGDAAVARLRLSHLLATADLRTPAMPPSAVLVVRSMADPLPGHIAGELMEAVAISREWERAAQDRMGEFYARAARPAYGPVSSTAESVLFVDYGELLACLARDLSSGSAGAWWWRSFLKRYRLRLPGSWTALWEEHPRYIPSALQYLSAGGHAVAVLERISPVHAWRVMAAAARAFGLPSSLIQQRVPASPYVAGQVPQDKGPQIVSSRGSAQTVLSDLESEWDARIRSSHRVSSRLPWEPYISPAATPSALGLERRALLGVGLLLCHAPAVALSTAFSVHFRDWLRTAAASAGSEREDPAAQSQPAEPSAAGRGGQKSVETPPPPRTASHAASREQPRPDFLIETGARSEDEEHLQFSLPRRSEVRPDWDAGVVTRLGGILYLIHLVRQMELVRHFETGLSGWALVELLARCLIEWNESVAVDTVWDALAELSAGGTFRATSTYMAPDSWLRNLDPRPLLVRCRSRGIELWRPEGFLVRDSEGSQIMAGCQIVALNHRDRRRFQSAAAVRPAGIAVSHDLRRFLHFVLPYARWRLGKALCGISLQEVFLKQGRLILSSSHVDLVMEMSQISVPVRLAGLDANPGWVPELGRVVTFHFEPEAFYG